MADTPSTADRVAFGREARSLWSLEEGLAFLNHGSFGAVPNELAAQAIELRREIERNPVAAIWRQGPLALREAAASVAAFVGSRPQHTAFVTNATAGLNAVLSSLSLAPGDEVLHLDQGYNAIWQTLRLLERRRGIAPRKVALPLPITRPAEVVEALAAAIGTKTRLIVLDQITSPTALRLPVGEVIEAAAARGVEVLVDGAHAPGMLEQPVTESRGAVAWTGNLHKWPCALRGCAVLVARADLAAHLHPPVISHFLDEGFAAEFDWQGTIDPTAWLLAPAAIALMDRLGGWPELRHHNHDLATRMHAMLCERLELEPLSPLDGSMLGSMATIRLPEALQGDTPHGGPEALQAELLARFRIELPVWDLAGVRYARISCHAYNEVAEYEQLAEALILLRDSA